MHLVSVLFHLSLVNHQLLQSDVISKRVKDIIFMIWVMVVLMWMTVVE